MDLHLLTFKRRWFTDIHSHCPCSGTT